MEGAFPLGWAKAPIGDVAPYVQRGKSPKYTTSSDLPVINQKCVRWAGLEKEHARHVHESQIPSWDEQRYLKEGDLLWNSTGTGTIGRACLYRNEFPQAVVDSHVTIVRCDQRALHPPLLRYFVMSPFVQHTFEEMQSGSTNQVELSKRAILVKEMPLPPLPEQRRIVEKIEMLFTQLDKGEEAVRQVQALLKRYRQSVLKAAVTGALTADWRAENRDKLEHGRDLLARILDSRRETWSGRGHYKEPVAPDTSGLPELPEEWVWATLAQLTSIKGGVTVDRKREPADPVALPYLRVANVQNGYLDLREIKQIAVDRDKAEQCLLEPGDILLNEGGDRDKLGRGWVWQGEIETCIHQNHVFRARPVLEDTPSYFISYYANAFGQPFFMTRGKQSVNLASISLTAISGLPIPLPSFEEQREILRLVEERLQQVEVISRACETELVRSAALRQSILKQAFSGRLVPQDPADEPASDLLARIRAAAPVKKTRKAKA